MELFDLELDDEYSNYFMTSFISVFNQMVNGEKFNIKSFIKAVKKAAGDDIDYFSHDFMKDLMSESDLLLNIEDSGSIYPNYNKTIPIYLTNVEKIYLKSILNSRYSKILLDNDDIEKLMSNLKNVPNLRFDSIFQFAGTKGNNSITDDDIDIIRKFLYAINNKSAIKYSNKARNGNIYINKLCYPVRLEYSVIQGEFSVSVWSAEEARPVKLNISTLYDVCVDNRIWNYDISPQEMMQKHLNIEPLVVEVNNEKNAIERFLFAFSMYDKRTETLDNGKIRITIYYYDFDKFEILNNILSFGISVKVISPTEIIESLIEKMKNF